MKDDEASVTGTQEPLICIECGSTSFFSERGWRAYVLEAEVIVYCPECAGREFDDAE